MSENKLKYATQNLFLIDKEEHIIGDYLYDKNNELIGKIEGLVVELPKHNVIFLAITQGGFLNIQGKKILVPRQACEIKDIGKVIVSFSKQTIQDAPSPHDIFNLKKSEELLILDYFGY
jgi:hypothetical protein